MNQGSDLPAAHGPADFLNGGGRMGELTRAHDWSGTLGPPQTWPQSLRTVTRLMLTNQHPMCLFWGPEHVCLYNDAFISLVGPEQHPRLLGAQGRLVWDSIWEVIGPQIELVMSGQGATWNEDQLIPLFRRGGLDEAYFTYGYSPIDENTAPTGVGGVLVVCAETTQKVLFGKLQAFRLQLEAALRPQTTPAGIVATGTRLLGELLQASRCCYLDAESGSEYLLVRSDWIKTGTPRLRPRIHLSELGPSFMAWHRNEPTLRVDDPEGEVVTFLAKEVARPAPSGVAAPLVKQGRLMGALCAYPGGPLRWTEQHEALIRDVAERLWEAVDQAHAAAERDRTTQALRSSEARYRSLVEASAAIVWEMPATGGFETPQPGWTAFTGQTFEQLKGWGWLNAVHPEDQDATAEALGRAFDRQTPFEVQYRLRTRAGDYHLMLIRGVPMMNPDGTLCSWVGIHRNLSTPQPAKP